jgi:nucleoid DNA-binding protein
MGKLTIQEVAKILTEKNGLEPREASRFAAEMFSVILQKLQEGDTVKVKGLGTFKIINVEARESVSVRTGERVVIDSHAKVTFTPDTIMRELVNKPFSQFETVVLNDGVEFDDIKDDTADDVVEEPVTEESVTEEPVAEEQRVLEESVPVEEQAVVEEPVAVEETETPAVEEEPVVEEPAVEEEPVVEEPVVEEPAVEEASEDKEPAELISFYEEEKQESERHWGRWLLGGVIVLILLVGAAFGGYEYGRRQQVLIPDTVFVRDTVYMPELQDSAEVKEAEKTIINEMKTPTVAKEESKEASKVDPKAEPQKEELDQWSAKDERVRLGAYRIVGLSHEVTVLEGQTFYSICRAHLGPDMQCYVEVYNNLPRNPQIKTGQVLKIPKLELRKRRK